MSNHPSGQSKVLIVANTTWNIYNFRLNLLRRLTQEGYEIVVVAPKDEYIIYQKEFPNIRHLNLTGLNRKGTNLWQDLRLLRNLSRIYAAEKPNLVLHYTIKPNIYGSFAARYQNIPSISVITGLGYSYINNGLLYKLVEKLYQFSLQHNSFVVFENQDDRRMFINRQVIPKEKGISIKGCGVNIEHFKPNITSLPSEKLVFSFIGRLLKDKGLSEFVEAAKIIQNQNPTIQFWVVGDIDPGNPASFSKKEIERWQKSGIIKFLGFKKDVRPIIAQSTCVVLPSYREAIARSITEAMAMEKPVIATNTAGCKEAISPNENGYLVPIKDANALADAVLKMSHLSPEKRTLMGQKGREKVLALFDDRIIADKLVGLIQQVLHKSVKYAS